MRFHLTYAEKARNTEEHCAGVCQTVEAARAAGTPNAKKRWRDENAERSRCDRAAATSRTKPTRLAMSVVSTAAVRISCHFPQRGAKKRTLIAIKPRTYLRPLTLPHLPRR